MTVEEASKILKMLLGYLKGEIEPPSPKTIEEAEKFEQEGYECLNMAIRSLEAWELIVKDIKKKQRATGDPSEYCGMKMALEVIDEHLKEV